MNNKLKHLEFIQATISRVAGHSFLLKGWGITLAAVLFALVAKAANSKYIVVAYFLVFVFWLLDGYFLWQERLFRALYNEVRIKKEGQINFSMDIEKFRGGKSTWVRSIFSTTLLIFYLSLLLIMLLIMYFLN